MYWNYLRVLPPLLPFLSQVDHTHMEYVYCVASLALPFPDTSLFCDGFMIIYVCGVMYHWSLWCDRVNFVQNCPGTGDECFVYLLHNSNRFFFLFWCFLRCLITAPKHWAENEKLEAVDVFVFKLKPWTDSGILGKIVYEVQEKVAHVSTCLTIFY